MWRKTALGLALSAASALPHAIVADAAVIDGVVSGAGQIAPVEEVQFVYGGRNCCWYGNGVAGPVGIGVDTPTTPASAGEVRTEERLARRLGLSSSLRLARRFWRLRLARRLWRGMAVPGTAAAGMAVARMAEEFTSVKELDRVLDSRSRGTIRVSLRSSLSREGHGGPSPCRRLFWPAQRNPQ